MYSPKYNGIIKDITVKRKGTQANNLVFDEPSP